MAAPKSLGPVPFLDLLFPGYHVHAMPLPHCGPIPSSSLCLLWFSVGHSIAPSVSSQPISLPLSHPILLCLPPHLMAPYPVPIPSPSTRHLSVPILMAPHPSHSSARLLGTLVLFPTSNSNPFTLGSPCGTMRKGLLRIYRTCPRPQTPRPLSCSILGPRYSKSPFTVPTALRGLIDT